MDMLGWYAPVSNLEMYERSTSASNARRSCEICFSFRACRSTFPKTILMSTPGLHIELQVRPASRIVEYTTTEYARHLYVGHTQHVAAQVRDTDGDEDVAGRVAGCHALAV